MLALAQSAAKQLVSQPNSIRVDHVHLAVVSNLLDNSPNRLSGATTATGAGATSLGYGELFGLLPRRDGCILPGSSLRAVLPQGRDSMLRALVFAAASCPLLSDPRSVELQPIARDVRRTATFTWVVVFLAIVLGLTLTWNLKA